MADFFQVDAILSGLASVFQWEQLLWLAVGVVLGLIGGTLPGISGATMLSVMLVFVFKFPLDCMVIAMAGIYAASTYSGSTAGILYNVPGDAPGIPSTIEGYALTREGRSLPALTAALSGSFFGAVVSFFLMLIMVPVFLYLVTFIGSGERALFALWALVIITGGALTRDDSMRGLASMAVGLFLGSIGMQQNIGTIRFVQGQINLWDGLDLLWVVLGIFAIPQLVKLPYIKVQKQETIKVNPIRFFRDCFVMIRQNFALMLKSSVLGTVIGAIPGIGGVTASWVGYSTAERSSRDPSRFGKGAIEGIVGAEAANNAAVPGTFIPLLSLGIPGSAANAIILGAFIAAGVYPGPSMMQTNGDMVWTILFGIGLSAVVFLLLGVPFIKMAQMMVVLPNEILIAFIGVLSMLGTYLSKYSVYGAVVTILIGLFVMASAKFGVIPSSMLLGYILGPTIEVEFIRAYQIGGFARFFQPVSLALLIIIAVTLAWGIVKNRQRKSGACKARSEKEQRELEYLEELDEESGVASGHDSLKDAAFGVFGLALAAHILVSIRSMSFLAQLWPLLIAVFFLALPCAVMLARGLRKSGEIRASLRGGGGRVAQALKTEQTLNFVVIVGALTLSSLCINLLGFVGASALFSLVVLAYFSRKPVRTAVGTIVFGLAIWAMRVAFTFPLPTGILGL